MIITFHNEENIFLHNDNITPIPSTGQFIIPEGVKIFYEVVRVINGTPLFFKEHLERLQRSLQVSGLTTDFDQLSENIFQLIERRSVKEKNLRISIYCPTQNQCTVLSYFVESHYPPINAYENGVRVELIPLERKNPNIKLENPQLRQSADKALCLSQTHEALLVNSDGYITEGSRSNFFAITNNKLITPPAKHVLEGITRKMVIRLAKENGIAIEERLIHIDELKNIDGAFITGTSPKVLPITQIGEHQYGIPQIAMQLLTLYDLLAEEDLKQCVKNRLS